MKSNFTNTGKLVRMILRRERIASTIWIIILSAFSIALAPALTNMFGGEAREGLTVTINNPAMIAMLGPIYGIENYTAGALYFNMMVQWVMITAAIMNVLFVIRHTRSDEESGRTDMLRSLPTGKFSVIAATMIAVFGVDFLIALLTGIGIGACNVESMGWNGSLLYGAAIGMSGFVFAALAAVFSQLCTSSRGAVGLSIMAVGGLYLLRGAGDIGNEVLAYISPLGLAQRTQAYVGNVWWPIAVLCVEALVIMGIAVLLNVHRDIRQGLLPEKNGKGKASAFLKSPYGLAFRLLRISFFAWVAGMFVVGASYGSILGTIESFVEKSEFYSMIIGMNPDYTTAQMFVSMVTSLMALCTTFPIVTMVLKVRSEERDGFFRNILSGTVSRHRYLAGYTFMAIISSVVIQCATALGIYTSAVAVLPDASDLPLGYMLKANIIYVPALLVMVGVTVFLIGVVPKATPVIWGYFGFSFFATFLSRLPDFLPDWMKKLTPFGWIPNLPVEEINWTHLIIVTVLAFVLMGIGFAGYRRRDISSMQ